MTIPGFTGAASRYRSTLNYTGSAAASPVVDADLVSLQKFLQPACRTGFTYCDEGYCANLRSDVKNCGSCGHECDLGTRCVKGFCMCGSIKCLNGLCSNGKCTCPTGTTLCSGACINLQTDSANCGSCGHTCLSGQECIAGGCKCPDISCKGTCVDSQNDPNNCGGCGTICPKGQSCNVGQCVSVCPGGCPDTQVCINGSCSCPAGTTLCNDVDDYCCGGPGDLSSQKCCPGYDGLNYCVDTGNDWENCGKCKNVCQLAGENAGCYHGVCGNCYDTSMCTNTDPSATCCNSNCTKTQTDPLNCGGCGNKCQLPSTTCCDSNCTDTQTDSSNCGTCHNKCQLNASCQGGQCKCNTGYIYCPASGTCVGTVTEFSALGGYTNFFFCAGDKCADSSFDSDCEYIRGLTVVLQVKEDMVSDIGFDIQLNANSPPESSVTAWQQYGFSIVGNSIQGFINNWMDGQTAIVCEYIDLCSTPRNNGIPSGYSLVLQLLNDSSGNVTGATYQVFDNYGNNLANKDFLVQNAGCACDGGLPWQTATCLGFKSIDLAPITAFTVVLVGTGDDRGTTFSLRSRQHYLQRIKRSTNQWFRRFFPELRQESLDYSGKLECHLRTAL